jgi:zinc/manganese transport system permease protein
MTAAELLVAPFADFSFMRRALAGGLALALAAAPLGVFLVLRRMSLVGDTMAHAILPGAVIGYLVAGLSAAAMMAGAFVAALVVFLAAGAFARFRLLPEDAGFAVFYLVALAAGVTLASKTGGALDLERLLFGAPLALDDGALLMAASAASLSAFGLAVLYRALVMDCVDPGFLRAVGGPGAVAHLGFLALVAVVLVAGFAAVGALTAVALMILPAVAARFWAGSIGAMVLAATAIGALGVALGLIGSYHADVPTGPAIVLALGALALASGCFGPRDGLVSRLAPQRHLEG